MSNHIDILQRAKDYKESHCWQYDIRLKNQDDDLIECGIEDISKISISDFVFKPLFEKCDRKSATEFIKRHEWLGNLSQYTTHWFGAYYNKNGVEILAGVILMNMPNAFSKLLGEETKKIERLVSRGACISWSPKNLASKFLMWSIDWMVKNTEYRLFTAYSDPTAKELGTIYQACNFYYLGQKSGTTKRYINPYTGRLVSDRFFRVRSAYKKYAKELGLEWGTDWNNDQRMLWDNIPDDIEERIREFGRNKQKNATFHTFPQKHKYAYIKGVDKTETKALKKTLLERNTVYDYPKERGL